jgi:hypothetical protein
MRVRLFFGLLFLLCSCRQTSNSTAQTLITQQPQVVRETVRAFESKDFRILYCEDWPLQIVTMRLSEEPGEKQDLLIDIKNHSTKSINFVFYSIQYPTQCYEHDHKLPFIIGYGDWKKLDPKINKEVNPPIPPGGTVTMRMGRTIYLRFTRDKRSRKCPRSFKPVFGPVKVTFTDGSDYDLVEIGRREYPKQICK